MVLDPIPQFLPVHFLGLDPSPPPLPTTETVCLWESTLIVVSTDWFKLQGYFVCLFWLMWSLWAQKSPMKDTVCSWESTSGVVSTDFESQGSFVGLLCVKTELFFRSILCEKRPTMSKETQINHNRPTKKDKQQKHIPSNKIVVAGLLQRKTSKRNAYSRICNYSRILF